MYVCMYLWPRDSSDTFRKRTRWASRTKSRSRSQNVSSLALYRRRIPNPVSTSYNIYTKKNCHILVKNSWLLILCFVEGNKFIGFIITVTCLPSLKKDVTLPYLTLTLLEFQPYICEQFKLFFWTMLEVIVKDEKWSVI